MAGSILIHETDVEKLRRIEDIEDLGGLDTIPLDLLTTIDFQEIAEAHDAEWTGSEPILFDEEGGMVLLKVESSGRRALLDETGFEEDEVEDVRKIRAFVDRNGFDDIYEFATF